MPGPAVFADSNVLVYLFDSSEREKQAIALDLFARETRQGRLHLSTQVLQEFYSAVTRVSIGLSAERARDAVAKFAGQPLIVMDAQRVLQGIDYAIRFKTSFWDGLILAAAKACHAAILFSENFSHGRVYDGVRVVNPFRG